MVASSQWAAETVVPGDYLGDGYDNYGQARSRTRVFSFLIGKSISKTVTEMTQISYLEWLTENAKRGGLADKKVAINPFFFWRLRRRFAADGIYHL
jgi:hypothetical protein